jgi:hypothetical protein
MATGASTVVTDLTVRVVDTTARPSAAEPSHPWRRIEKDLYLNSSYQRGWLYVAVAEWNELTEFDLVLADIRVGERPCNSGAAREWDSRPAGIWIQRKRFDKNVGKAVTDVDVLFGSDAVDPRPNWTLTKSPLRLNAEPTLPNTRLTFLRGKAVGTPFEPDVLRFDGNGHFKILQISDTHMVTGVGVCDDAIDADGRDLLDCDADPLTVKFMNQVLDAEQPDLVILAGDQLHHDILDTQSALFKVVAPMVEREIPFAAVFGNHDSEGSRALSRRSISIARQPCHKSDGYSCPGPANNSVPLPSSKCPRCMMHQLQDPTDCDQAPLRCRYYRAFLTASVSRDQSTLTASVTITSRYSSRRHRRSHVRHCISWIRMVKSLVRCTTLTMRLSNRARSIGSQALRRSYEVLGVQATRAATTTCR